MSDNVHPHTPAETDLSAQLDAWGAEERARIAAPPETFLRQVRAVQRPRVLRRVLEGLALAAAVALVAYVALRSGPAPKPIDEKIVRRDPPAPDRVPDAAPTLAGMTRQLLATGSLDELELPTAGSANAPATSDIAAPTRAADAYCAGCLDELTRL